MSGSKKGSFGVVIQHNLNISLPFFLCSVHKQQQARPGPVTESGDGREEPQRGQKRAAFGERRANQGEYPQEFSISKYVFSYMLGLKAETQLCIIIKSAHALFCSDFFFCAESEFILRLFKMRLQLLK